MATWARSLYFLNLILLLSGLASAQSGWFSQTSGTTNTLPGVSFADANNGWVVGGAGSSSTILHTCTRNVEFRFADIDQRDIPRFSD